MKTIELTDSNYSQLLVVLNYALDASEHDIGDPDGTLYEAIQVLKDEIIAQVGEE